ncbi:MAG: metallophosphoesterase [Magnetococcales bacterium]|nr:metallophosphoesterase [Magnetococcales bacterium]
MSALFERLRSVFLAPKVVDEVELIQEVHLMGDEIRVPFNGLPMRLIMGRGRQGKTLWLCPDFFLDPDVSRDNEDYILFDPDHFFKEATGFFRLEPGDSLVLGRESEEQQRFFHFPRNIARRHLTIAHTGDAFVFKDLTAESGTYIGPLGESMEEEKVISQRVGRLARLREIYGGPIALLPTAEAMATLNSVNEILKMEASRPVDDRGMPGGLLNLPVGLAPLVVGDLHSQVDNLLKILTENHFLEGLEQGTLCLILLGDAVHSEVDGQMGEMESSLLMMDFIFRLKIRFPSQVFYVRGNHDSFSEEVGKAGVPQGILWEREIRKRRGEAYKEAMDLFYESLPYCVRSDNFIACHAGPPKAKATEELLINMYKYPGLVRELTWNRLRRPNYPAGYTRLDVVRFRKGLEVAPNTPFIVAHNPISRDVSVWMDVGKIVNHHIIFSGMTDQVSVFFLIKGQISPLVYKTEPLCGLLNRL